MTDEMSFDDLDPEAYITDDGRCSLCFYQLDFDDLKALHFEAEESGEFVNPIDGYRSSWAIGTILCPNCQDRLPYEVTT